MVTGQHDGMALLILGVSTLAQLMGLALEFTSSPSNITAWNIQGLQPISENFSRAPVVAWKYLDSEVMVPKTCHRGN